MSRRKSVAQCGPSCPGLPHPGPRRGGPSRCRRSSGPLGATQDRGEGLVAKMRTQRWGREHCLQPPNHGDHAVHAEDGQPGTGGRRCAGGRRRGLRDGASRGRQVARTLEFSGNLWTGAEFFQAPVTLSPTPFPLPGPRVGAQGRGLGALGGCGRPAGVGNSPWRLQGGRGLAHGHRACGCCPVAAWAPGAPVT